MNVALPELTPIEVGAQSIHQKVQRLEAVMRQMPQLDLPVNHHFAEGVYVRELPIPAGAVVVGKLHRQSHVLLLIKGDVTIVTHEGRQRVQAPWIVTPPAGSKRAFVAHEDSILVTAHGSSETDVEKLELQLIEPEDAQLPGTSELLELLQ